MPNRALVLPQAGLDHRTFEDREMPVPGPGEVVVRLRGSSLNYHDFVVLQGMIPGMQFPRVPLSDGAGEVAAVGDGVARFAEGDRVCTSFFRDWVGGPPESHHWSSIFGDTLDGCAQQYLAVPQEVLTRTPTHLSDREAGTLTCAGVTASDAPAQKLDRAAAIAPTVVSPSRSVLLGAAPFVSSSSAWRSSEAHGRSGLPSGLYAVTAGFLFTFAGCECSSSLCVVVRS